MMGMDKETRKAKAAAKKAQKEAKNIGSVVSENVKQNLQNQINNTKASFSDAETLGKPANNLNADTNNKVEAQSVTQAITPNNTVEQPKPAQTISDMLAPFREKAKQEKTDAVKMQKYYALADALKSLGHMGGAAIGGAIGGNVLDSAPKVGEYQQSRGYIDAFEKAKKANDRLRDLDDYEFKLNNSKQQRDEERAHQDNVRAKEQANKIAFQNLQNEWSMKFFDYQTQIEQAYKDKDFNRVAALKKNMQDDAQAHQIEMQKLQNEGYLNTALAKISGSTSKNTTPVSFKNGTVANIPDDYYKSLMKTIMDNQGIDESEARLFIESNPEFVIEYLGRFGIGTGSTQKDATSQETYPSAGLSMYGYPYNTVTNYVEDLDDYLSQFE